MKTEDKLKLAQDTHAQCMRTLEILEDYDANSPLMGAVGELWAEVNLGMTKAERGAEHIDGTTPDGRRLQVKAKRAGAHRDSGTYVTMPKDTKADDLLIVFVADDGEITRIIGPVPTNLLQPKGRGNRCYVSDIVKAIGDK
ncbi:hypothetical protein BXY66_1591 [Shimia isoporae]|uniref:DUF6998 domain-containing protein n=1 Tax=Shimia isoporae TaxID=647720 RepID=A0A4V2Q434_9RHOB|nr:hypothetical protein [Shimia isoporae]TCL09540.1 hypothetical protein BXY66_1591 [Shimia isoporae]